MIAVLVLGLLSIGLGIVSFFVLWWLSIIGLVLGVVGIALAGSSKHWNELTKNNDDEEKKRVLVLPIVGTVMNSIDLIIALISILIMLGSH